MRLRHLAKPFAVAVGFAAVVALVLGQSAAQSRAQSGAQSPATQPVTTSHRGTDPIVSWITIGGSGPSDNQAEWQRDRMVGNLSLHKGGWQGFIDDTIRPQVTWGCRRFVLHNPFGISPAGPMDFDEFLLARGAGLRWLTDDFATAWRKLIEAQRQSGQPIEAIAYFGDLPDCDRMTALARSGHVGDWLARAFESIRPALDAGMSIGLDAASTQSNDSPTAKFAGLLRSLGVKVYVESRPGKDSTWAFDAPIVSAAGWWDRSDPAKSPDAKPWAAGTEKLTGEVLLIVEPDWRNPADVATKTKAVIAGGFTAATGVSVLVGAGITRDQVVPK